MNSKENQIIATALIAICVIGTIFVASTIQTQNAKGKRNAEEAIKWVNKISSLQENKVTDLSEINKFSDAPPLPGIIQESVKDIAEGIITFNIIEKTKKENEVASVIQTIFTGMEYYFPNGNKWVAATANDLQKFEAQVELLEKIINQTQKANVEGRLNGITILPIKEETILGKIVEVPLSEIAVTQENVEKLNSIYIKRTGISFTNL